MLDAIAKTPTDMAKFAADFEHIMNDFDFFKEHPIYKYRIIETQLHALDIHSVMRYYPNGHIIDADIINVVYQKSTEDFGEHAPFINWLFHRYHVFYRQNLELSARIRQLESQRK